MRAAALLIALVPLTALRGQEKKPAEEVVLGRLEAETTEVRPRVTGYITALHVREGAAVKKGAVLAELDSRAFKIEVDRARAKLVRAEAQAKQADARLESVRAAVRKGIVPKEDVEQAEAEREVSRAEMAVAKAGLELAELQLSWTNVAAPFDGRLGRPRQVEGNIVRADTDTLVTLVRTDPLFVAFELDERTALQMRPALKEGKWTAAVGFIDEKGFPHEAAVDSVAAAINPETGTLRLRARLPNPKDLFVPGTSVRIRITPGK